MKLLIVDDEKYIRESLKNGYDWYSLGFDEIFEAGNVKQALGIIRNNEITVIITDIKMPNMIGTKLVEEVSHLLPNAKIIILSGYGEFEYAQLALKYGVVDYLLKPIAIEDIVKSVKKAITAATTNDISDKYKAVLRKDFLYNIILNRITNEKDIIAGVEEYELDILKTPFCLVIFLDNMMIKSQNIDINIVLDIEKYFSEVSHAVIFEDNTGHIMILLKENMSEQELLDVVNNCCNKINKEYDAIDLVAYICSVNDVMELSKCYYKTIDVMDKFTLTGDDRVVFVSDIENTKIYNIIRMTKKYVNEHLAENITVDTMADMIHISCNYFSSIFKKATGKGFNQYVNETKIEKAILLLKITDMPVSEVAEAVGYEVKYFNRVFKKYIGITPGEYRKKNTKSEGSIESE